MKRREAREAAVQSLYFMDMNDVAAQEAIRSVMEDWGEEDGRQTAQPDSSTAAFIHRLVEQTWSKKEHIDELLSAYLTGWKTERLSRVDLQILRLAVYEMFYDKQTPPKVVINEAIELAKYFGSEESGKFVNGVLGKMLREQDVIQTKL